MQGKFPQFKQCFGLLQEFKKMVLWQSAKQYHAWIWSTGISMAVLHPNHPGTAATFVIPAAGVPYEAAVF